MLKIKNTYFNSYPIIFHYNGNSHVFLDKMFLKKQVFNYFSGGSNKTFRDRKENINYPIPTLSNLSSKLSNELTILIITNLKEKGSAARSLDYFNFPYTVVGQDIVQYTPYEKYKKIINFIDSVKTKYLMLLDSDDIFIIDGLNNLVENFEKDLNCKMLFNAEPWDWPIDNNLICQKQTEFENSVSPKNTPFKYLNSGVWIANVDFLKETYKTLVKLGSDCFDDQAIFKKFYKIFFPQVKIDHCCKYFQSLQWSKKFDEKYKIKFELEII